jgi:NAD(P)H-nitrite reductase large subunit
MNQKDLSLAPESFPGERDMNSVDDNFPIILRGPGAPSLVDVKDLDGNTIVCACRGITKSSVVDAINTGHASLPSIAHCCKAGSDCQDCHDQIAQLIVAYKPSSPKKPKLNKIEEMKLEKDGLDCLPDIWRHAESGNWEEMTEDDKHRFKWYGVFFRKQTPGNFMLRLRMSCGFSNARQFRVLADMSDEFGKGFCDLTTRQQIQMRWFTIDQVPEIWRRLADVGLTSQQTGMDNIRGVCGCPLSGVTPHELFDAAPVAKELTSLILNNKEFTNPRANSISRSRAA